MTAGVAITPLAPSPEVCGMLSEILIETVANGGNVTFMHLLAPETARAFCNESLAAAAMGKRVVLGARSSRMAA